MTWTILSLNDSDLWNSAIKELPENQQDIYYTPEYYRLYKEYGDGEPFCFVFRSDNHIALYPFLKNPVNTHQFGYDNKCYDIQGAYGYNGAISSSFDEKFKDKFRIAFEEFCKTENIIAEFTRFHPLLNNHSFFDKRMTVIKDRQTVWLNLEEDYESIWSNAYSSNNRNMIRKSQKNNIRIEITSDENEYQDFYYLYLNTMKEVGALPYYYFDPAYALNFNSFLGMNQKLFFAVFEDKKICTMLMMIYGEYAHYHLSGRVKEFANLAANNLILDAAIQFAKQQGARVFHFGGGNSNNSDDPLYKFKSNFSKARADFYIGKKVHNPEIYNKICQSWEVQNPEKKEKYSKFLLKYRM
ncbi:MAG: GNAT family N-acetyltransferase [Bacteroidales bacterium]